jgi:hypothetical protein
MTPFEQMSATKNLDQRYVIFIEALIEEGFTFVEENELVIKILGTRLKSCKFYLRTGSFQFSRNGIIMTLNPTWEEFLNLLRE